MAYDNWIMTLEYLGLYQRYPHYSKIKTENYKTGIDFIDDYSWSGLGYD